MRLIDADALKEEVNKKKVVGRFNTIMLIDNAPTIALERPSGEWINTSPYDDKGECSLCCYLSKKYYKFCPYCGADMRGEAE